LPNGRHERAGRVATSASDDALAELARVRADGALGVVTLANIRGRDMRLDEFSLATPVGFMVDTTLAFARLILSGFLDRYPRPKLIALRSRNRQAPICAASSMTRWSTSRGP
jgi:hypothetical protein